MNVLIEPSAIKGEVAIIPSKSHLHRLLICAALATKECLLCCQDTQAEDIQATIACLEQLGARIDKTEQGFLVRPIETDKIQGICRLPCRESGSTLRFLLPIMAALGVTVEFHMEGRLPQRPMDTIIFELSRMGAVITRPKETVLRCEGKLREGAYCLAGNISSQYISGLLFALPLLDGDSVLDIVPPIESKPYIDMTVEAQNMFGISHVEVGTQYKVAGNTQYQSPASIKVEGDWSNAAFWLCGGSMPKGDVTVTGLHKDSLQGDKEVLSVLKRMGAQIHSTGNAICIEEKHRVATVIDAKEIPDLVPVLAAVAAVSEGETHIVNAKRLRLKESDRLESVTQTLSALGAKIEQREDGLVIQGVKRLQGGTVDTWGDHRIAMMAAIVSTACLDQVEIQNAQVVNKSYPTFWSVLSSLGVIVRKDVKK